jgi:iron complex outermembrane receptor protein
MRTSKKMLAVLLSGSATLLWGLPAGAQTANTAETDSGGDIVVTAQRREQSLQDVPQSVQAVSGESLIRAGIVNVAQSIQLVPSATTGSTISAGSNAFQIRGVAASETDGDATVGFYLDNFAFNLPGRPFAPAADFYDLQRVEVLRGPSGTLYGLGSLGGTIKVLTNDPNLNEYEGSARMEGASTWGGQPGGSADAMFNAALIPGKLAVRAVVSYKLIGGYADAIPSGEKNANDASSFTGRIKLLAQPTDELKIRLAYWRNESKQNFSNRITYADPAQLDQTSGIANSSYSLFSGDIEYDLGFATLQSSTGYIKNTVVTNNAGVIPGIGRFDNVWPLVSKNFNEDLRLTSNGSGPFRYIVGAFYQNGRTVGGQSVALPDYALPGVTGIATFNDNTLKSRAFAVYGEGTYSAFDRKLDLTVGGRYYEEKRTFVENSSLTLISLGSVTPTIGTESAKNHTFNPRFNVAYHPTSNGMLYFEAAKGFRSGAITSTSIIAGANLALGTAFSNSSPPDTLWNYEAGVKWTLFDNKVRVAVSGYYFDWKDAQIELSPTLQSIVVPVGSVHGRGLDAEISWNTPLPGLRLAVSGNVNRTRLVDVVPEVAAGLPWISNGAQLPGTAKRTLAVSASYATPINGSGLEFRVNGRYTYRAKQQSVYDGRYAPWAGLGSLRAGVGNDQFDVTVFSENIGNSNRPISLPGGQVQIPYPRTIGISLGTKF